MKERYRDGPMSGAAGTHVGMSPKDTYLAPLAGRYQAKDS